MSYGFDYAAKYLAEVRQTLGMLDESGLDLVEYRYDGASFGNAVVVLEAPRLRLVLTKDRGQNFLSLGPRGGPVEAFEVVLEVLGKKPLLPDGRFLAEASLSELTDLLEQHRTEIAGAFSGGRAEQTFEAAGALKARRDEERFGRIERS